MSSFFASSLWRSNYLIQITYTVSEFYTQFQVSVLYRKVVWIQPCHPSVRSSVTVFSGLASYFFLIFTWIQSSINTKSDGAHFFEENFHAQNALVNAAFLGTKINILNFSLNQFIRFFWNCTWWQAVMSR